MIWVLGSSGWMPAAGRETAAFLVEMDGELILLDAGTGVANLAAHADVLARHTRLSVLLSHYHLDHVAGLMYLKRFAANMQVTVYGPGRPAYPRTTADYLGDVLQRAVYSSGPRGFAARVEYRDYGGEDFSVGRVRVGVRPQQHSAPSFELRLGDALTYASDTAFVADAWREYPRTKVLLHECWEADPYDARHTNARALADGLPRDKFERVLLVHQNPSWSADERAQVARLAASRGMELAEDGDAIAL